MRGRRTVLGALAMILALAACGGGGTGSQAGSGGAGEDAALAGLPSECVDEIRSFLVAVEPIAEGIDFSTVSEADLQALAPASDAFDPDVCPDVSQDEARAAWLAVAEESAPGAIPFIEFTYAD